MKKLIIIFLLIPALTMAQPKEDSLVVRIEMDSATWKGVIQLIKENINGQSLTGKIVLQSIMAPLYQIKLVPREKIVADKPKQK